MNDNLYFATSAGEVVKFDYDGTPLAVDTLDVGKTISLPMHMASSQTLLVAPSNQDSLTLDAIAME